MKPLHQLLLNWYRGNKRNLPWRKNKDPYRVWLSEIMLQQTRVEAARPYYERFLSHFPTITDLANASEEKVTNLWAGLGYYSRARNLHKAARLVQKNFAGNFPSTTSELRSLPGIGEYTAAAIASICFKKNIPAIDGNLERVIARLSGLRKNPKTEGKHSIKKFATTLVLLGEAGEINQALMDLASSVCLPKNPRCELCPIQKYCRAHAQKITDKIPVRAKKRGKISLSARGVIYLHKGALLVAKRPQDQWLAGMWDIPWWLGEEKRELPGTSWGQHEASRTITHHKIQFHVDFIEGKSGDQKTLLKSLHDIAAAIKWINLDELHGVHLPSPTEKALNEALRTFALV